MPKQTESQAIGQEGERWFAAQLPSTWIPQLPSLDVGVDMLVVICEDGPLNGLEFRVQVKSTRTFHRKDKAIVVRGFPTRSLVDLVQGFTPALLVLYESDTKTGFCYWMNQLLAADTSLLTSTNETVTLHVPMTRPVVPELWPKIGNEVQGIMASVGQRVTMSELLLPLLEATHKLMQSLHLIDLCANGTGGNVPPEDLLHAEVTAHKEIVTTLLALDADLEEIGGPIVGIKKTAERYVQSCEEFVKGFTGFVEHSGPGYEYQVAPQLMYAYRVEAFRAVTQIVSKLSLLSLEGAKSRQKAKANKAIDSDEE